MGKLFDFMLDAVLAIMSGIAHFPRTIGTGCVAIIRFPFNMSLFYRLQRIWYPYVFERTETTHYDDKNPYRSNEKKQWLDENIGKYRWRIIKRRGVEHMVYDRRPEYSFCFRHKSDAMAFKLRWTE